MTRNVKNVSCKIVLFYSCMFRYLDKIILFVHVSLFFVANIFSPIFVASPVYFLDFPQPLDQHILYENSFGLIIYLIPQMIIHFKKWSTIIQAWWYVSFRHSFSLDFSWIFPCSFSFKFLLQRKKYEQQLRTYYNNQKI